jgi:hypothetical protein
MEPLKRVIDFRIDAESLPVETVILIPLAAMEHDKIVTYSGTVIKLTTTEVGFYRGWEAHFYWEAFGTVS